MSPERLLKRIRQWDRGLQDPVVRGDIAEYRQSVLNDIALLFNTQRGTVLISDELGLPDFTNLLNRFGSEEITFMEKSFQELMETFEPRLKGILVQYAPRDNETGLLRFLITGQLSFRRQNSPIAFYALLQGDGRITIEAGA